MIQDYPKHLIDPLRVSIATDLRNRELAKIGVLRFTKTKAFSSEIDLRDFWNSFHGVVMGFKLFKGLTQVLTSENITITKSSYPISKLSFAVVIEQTRTINPTSPISIEEFSVYYKNNPQEKHTQLEFCQKIFSKTAPNKNSRILLIEKYLNSKKVVVPYDGNNRLAYAALLGKKTIPAYLIQTHGPKLVNYWYPTSIIMEIIAILEDALRDNNQQVQTSIVNLLRNIIQSSKSARLELFNRALKKDSPAEKFIISKID